MEITETRGIDMFVGKFYNSIDSKSRMIVPAKFRDGLGGKCVIVKSIDPCLNVYPEEEWEIFVKEKLSKLSDFKKDTRMIKRYFHASAAVCDVDKQGRVTIPQELKQHAGIEKDLVTIGTDAIIEVWSKEHWEDRLDPDSGEVMDISQLAESMELYGL